MTLPDLPKERRKETFVVIRPGYMRHRAASSASSCEVTCDSISAPKIAQAGYRVTEAAQSSGTAAATMRNARLETVDLDSLAIKT
jgi:hypothetical protein